MTDPWAIGLAYEQSAGVDDRRRRGAWYTPKPVVKGLVAIAFESASEPPRRILDPTCGGGAFLLAALDALVDAGLEPTEALLRVRGSDLDTGAVKAARRSIDAWANQHSAVSPDLARSIVRLDALTGCAWAERPDMIVGNPPFASPLRSGALSDVALAYRNTHSAMMGPYADLAGLHLHRCLDLVDSGGVVQLIMPHSTLTSRDLTPLRDHCLSAASLDAVWITNQRVFDAGVRVWAPTMRNGAPRSEVTLYNGATPSPVGQSPLAAWGSLATDALGIPSPTMDGTTGTLSSLATATAGFRDEYYGLRDACQESAESESQLRLVTVGSIDPLRCSWGEVPIRFGSTRWSRPVIELDDLNPKVKKWCDARLVPKVLVATQTKILEPFVDYRGVCVPSTPLISVHVGRADLDRVAALLLAPAVVAWAYRRSFGSALSGDALKLASREVLEIPLPADQGSWDEAAGLVAAAHSNQSLVVEIARLMATAFASDGAIFDWWLARSGF